MKKILVAAPIDEVFVQFICTKGFFPIFINTKPSAWLDSQAHELLSSVSDLDSYDKENIIAIITSNQLKLHADTIRQYTHLKWIARMGSGMEIIDTSYCDLHGIRYFSSPKGIAHSVAEHIIGMLLNLTHHISKGFNEIKEGKWIREPNRGFEIEQVTLGLIGYGHTAQALAKCMSVFTPNIFAYDKYKKGFSSDIVKEVSLEYIWKHAYILSFHVPLNHETTHYYNDEFMNRMENKHILINTSRGAVCSTETIIKGLKSKKIVGACLDVLEEEANIEKEINAAHGTIKELLNYSVILTPHIAGYSHNAITKMSLELIEQINSNF